MDVHRCVFECELSRRAAVQTSFHSMGTKTVARQYDYEGVLSNCVAVHKSYRIADNGTAARQCVYGDVSADNNHRQMTCHNNRI